jgi:hypothetical protein
VCHTTIVCQSITLSVGYTKVLTEFTAEKVDRGIGAGVANAMVKNGTRRGGSRPAKVSG